MAAGAILLFGPASQAGELVGEWLFEEGKGVRVKDTSTGGLNGELVGNAAFVEGIAPGSKHAVQFPNVIGTDSSSFIRVGGKPEFARDAASFTISAWVRPETVETMDNEGPTIISIANSKARRPFTRASIQIGNGHFIAGSNIDEIDDAGKSFMQTVSDTELVPGKTYFVAARFDWSKNRIALSVYDAESGSWEHKPGHPKDFPAARTPDTPNHAVQFGRFWPGPPGFAFDGTLDDVRFHDAALTPKQVEKLVQQP